MSGALKVFLGPSLPAEEAKAIVECELQPPARQGDLFRALVDRPAMIVLIDGVFEASPSVWHHEILAANACGIPVLGAGSMGALRAAEMPIDAMSGCGGIYRAFARGDLVDDAEVALLHASEEHGYRALTIPLVNVRHAAEVAVKKKVLTLGEATELVEVARAVFYQERIWPVLLDGVKWSAAARKKWAAFAENGLPDLKADDARLALAQAKKWLARNPRWPKFARNFPSSVRRRRIHEEKSEGAFGTEIVHAIRELPEAQQWVGDGVRRKLVAFWAREMGLRVSPEELKQAEAQWVERLGFRPEQREALLASCGLDESQARTFTEEIALDAKACASSLWMVANAPSVEEAIAFEARRRGVWPMIARQLGRRPSQAH